MTMFERLLCAVPLAGMLLLVSCGGGGGAADALNQQASPGIAVGEPAPNGTPLDTAPFVARAQQEPCADLRNRLFVIDNKQVFWDRAGNCPDNSYAQRLFGATPEIVLCETSDSIIGPRTSCSDDQARAMFDIILKNRDQPDLGLGSAHKVEPVKMTRLAFQDVDRGSHSQISAAQDVVIRDSAAFSKLWSAHTGNSIPEPAIDFQRYMVVGSFLGNRMNGCYSTEITDVYRTGNKITVQRTDWEPGQGDVCTLAIVSPAHLVKIERSDDPVEFSSRTQTLH